MKKQFVIVGASAAGIAAANRLKMLAPESIKICISAEFEIPYNKCHIADYLAGSKTADQIAILDPNQEGITFIPGKRVLIIDRCAQKIQCDDGTILGYDALFLAMGSSGRMPPIQGIVGSGVYTFATLADAQALDALVRKYPDRNVAIIGAGLSGVECADALLNRGMKVTLFEQSHQLLSGHVDTKGSFIIEKAAFQKGLSLELSASVTEIIRNATGEIIGVQLDKQRLIPSDVVICATGLYPNSMLALKAGLDLQDGYIMVDECMRTNDPSIYAGGDVVMVKDQITKRLVPSCLWPDAMLQGMIAAYNMVGIPKAYPGAILITSSSFFGLKFAQGGALVPGDYQKVVVIENEFHYKRLVFEDEILKGFLLVGQTCEIPALRKALLTGQPYQL